MESQVQRVDGSRQKETFWELSEVWELEYISLSPHSFPTPPLEFLVQ